MVFTLGISGVVSAFEAASGALVWQTDAPDSLPIYGNPVSPLGVGELVIVHPGDYGSLTAFEAATGETAWTATGTGVFASPIVAELGGIRCFRHQLLLPHPYLVLTKPLRLDIQCQRAASVKIGWKYLDD